MSHKEKHSNLIDDRGTSARRRGNKGYYINIPTSDHYLVGFRSMREFYNTRRSAMDASHGTEVH